MTHSYNISGLTCQGCVKKAVDALTQVPGVTKASVQLEAPQATVSMQQHVPLQTLQNALSEKGKYLITEAEAAPAQAEPVDKKSWWQNYKPIVLIFAYIITAALLVQLPGGQFDGITFMRQFMAGFFLVFSFFKFLDLQGFADNYAAYDIIAKRWRAWGFIYAFLELILGIAFLTNFLPFWTNAFTAVLMTISLVGVLQSVLNKRKIQCACLGAVFNLPMSTVTIVEDSLMIGMSVVMLIVMSL